MQGFHSPTMTTTNSRTTGLTAMAEQPLTSQIPRHACFLLLMVATVAWFWKPLATVVSLSLQYGRYEHYSHIVLIPFISLYLLYINRSAIFAAAESAPLPGVLVMAIGVGSSWIAR